jgi:hypothetical protein
MYSEGIRRIRENQRIREPENQWIRDCENQKIRESEKGRREGEIGITRVILSHSRFQKRRKNPFSKKIR